MKNLLFVKKHDNQNKTKSDVEKYIAANLEIKSIKEVTELGDENLESINRDFVFIEDKKIAFIAKGNNNTLGPSTFAWKAMELAKKDYDVTVILLKKVGPVQNRALLSLEKVGVKIVPSDHWDRNDLSTQQYIHETNDAICIETILNKDNNPKMLTKQDFNISLFYVSEALEEGKEIYIEDYNNGPCNTTQDGPSEYVKKELDNMVREEKIYIEKNGCLFFPFVDSKILLDKINEDNSKVEVPELVSNNHISSESGFTERDNKHEIMVAEMHNELVESKVEGKIISEIENKMHIDLLVLYSDKATIYEFKSFPSKEPFKGLGQLLVYREKLSKRLGIPIENIEMVLVIPNTELSPDFISATKTSNIKIIKK